MSTISGFVIGALLAAGLTALYGDKLQRALSESAAHYLPPTLSVDSLRDAALADPNTPLSDTVPELDLAMQVNPVSEQSAPAPMQQPNMQQPNMQQPNPAQDTEFPTLDHDSSSVEQDEKTVEQLWAQYAAAGQSLPARGNFPWRQCFARAAASYELPESLLLAIARGESNFDPAARSDKDAVGLMQIRWPGTSKHLGIVREADLYDPCTNVDAGARYLQELTAKFDDNLHLAVAAYNYGPGAIAPGAVPPGARWYSQYIYEHLQHVLGDAIDHVAPPRPASSAEAEGQELLMSFNAQRRARDFIAFMADEIPGVRLQLNSAAKDHHEVVLLFNDEDERQNALSSISAAGISPLISNSKDRFHL